MLETQSRQTNELYDSRKVPRKKGIGYPSCSRELDRLPPNTADPHDYYTEIGVRPDAPQDEIRAAVRRLLRQLHPDSGGTDVERFQLVQRIGQVLLDPVAREKYNRTPKGMRLIDAVSREEMSRLTREELEPIFANAASAKTRNANPYVTTGNHAGRYDYFALGHLNDPWQADELKAQLWYHFLIEAAPMVNYRHVIKVLITDGEPEYSHTQNLMLIPRGWEPSTGAALSLFTVVAGFRPGHDDPETGTRHTDRVESQP